MKTKHLYQSGFGVLAVVIVAAIVVLIGTGGYYAAKSSKDNSKAPTTSATTTSPSTVNIKSLLALGKSLSCTFSRGDVNSTTTGVVYISNGQFRGDFNTTLKSGGTIDSHMIQKESKNYLWSSAQGNQGIVVNMMGASSMMMQATTSAQSSIDVDEALDYRCSDWSVDSSRFMTPPGIIFTDLSTMMKVSL